MKRKEIGLDEAQIAHLRRLAEIGQSAGAIAHDFNNMLTGIKLAAESINANINGGEKLKKYTEIITLCCERATKLTANLLNLSAEGQSSDYINAHECIIDGLYLLEQMIGKKIEIVKSLQAKVFFIKTNMDIMQRMLINLGLNARDAMANGGVIRIATNNVFLDDDQITKCVMKAPSREYLEIAFADDGVGISDEIKGKIFEPFFTTKGIGKGTGLGLPMIYDAVKAVDGTLRVESNNQGTTFYIYFPIVKDKVSEKIAESKILLVDDEPILLELMKEILIQNKKEVVSLADSTKVVEVYKNSTGIDLVMLDVMMPNVDGVELYQRLKKLNSKLKFMFLSGYNNDLRVAKIVAEDEKTAFMAKPYKPEEVIEKLAILLAKK